MKDTNERAVHNVAEAYGDTDMALPAGNEYNLSDFALFLSVMSNPEAYKNTLSVIMDEPEIELLEVKVEQVLLNKQGKKAIRLDAWAKSRDDRQFNMEMQNDSSSDSIPKRSRYYQSMLDTPILKSGRATRYRELSSTVIIFITQEDIFGRDLAKYTFSEQCEEICGLKLEDGTQKIFLNMSSRNGSDELVSLLQYMKNTSLDNPEIIVKDKRLLRLDEIVNEVKSSEEWEDFKMNIYSMGIEQGVEQGIKALIETCQELGCSKETTLSMVADKFSLSKESAEQCVIKYWV